MQVKAGQRLFSVTQNQRKAHFHAPLSGKVVKVNGDLGGNNGMLENLSYGRSWVCVIEGENLDEELPGLQIGKSAVALFQEDIDRFRAFLQKGRRQRGLRPRGALHRCVREVRRRPLGIRCEGVLWGLIGRRRRQVHRSRL